MFLSGSYTLCQRKIEEAREEAWEDCEEDEDEEEEEELQECLASIDNSKINTDSIYKIIQIKKIQKQNRSNEGCSKLKV